MIVLFFVSVMRNEINRYTNTWCTVMTCMDGDSIRVVVHSSRHRDTCTRHALALQMVGVGLRFASLRNMMVLQSLFPGSGSASRVVNRTSNRPYGYKKVSLTLVSACKTTSFVNFVPAQVVSSSHYRPARRGAVG